jgi:hypothetical protein
MKQKILDALKTRYSNLGLGDKALDGVASFLEKTVTDEANIDTVVAGDNVSAMLKAMQSSFDSLRGRNTELQRQLDEISRKPNPQVPPIPKPEPTESDEMVQLKARLAKMEENYGKAMAEKRNAGIVSDLRRKLKDGGSDNDAVLDLVLDRLTIGESDTADSLADKSREAYDAAYKKFYGNGVIPPVGTKQAEGYKAGMFDGEVARLRAEGKIPQK